jgi:protein-S-isoprenylcysteine O-methyltransferase Ste14
MDSALLALVATVTAYWLGVGVMIVRVRRHARRVVGVVPEQARERLMGLAWVPIVIAWIGLPWLAAMRPQSVYAVPAWATALEWYALLRLLAAIVAVLSLAATVKCWARMGKDWRMAVTGEPTQPLITDGLFARIRHPIYSFSILLMLCSMVILPTLPMLLAGCAHITLMLLKARNEERHLLAHHGAAYAQYLARTGRFVPRR